LRSDEYGLERQAVACEKWLRRIRQQIENVPLPRPQEQPAAVSQQPHLSCVVERLAETTTEIVAERIHQTFESGWREPASPQLGECEELENVDRSVAAFGEAA
jgi:hypothetical protein